MRIFWSAALMWVAGPDDVPWRTKERKGNTGLYESVEVGVIRLRYNFEDKHS